MVNEIVIDTKVLHKGLAHTLVNGGGTIPFSNFPFGVKVVVNNNFLEFQLFVKPSTVKFEKNIVNNYKKKPSVDLTVKDSSEGGSNLF